MMNNLGTAIYFHAHSNYCIYFYFPNIFLADILFCSSCEPVVPADDPVIREVTQVLREWNAIWKNLFVARETYKFSTLRKVMRELVDWRRELLTGTLTHDQTKEMRLNITSKIDWGNSERFLVKISKDGFSNYIEKLNSNCTLFTAVTSSNTDEKEFSFKAYQTEDKDFHQLHEFIIRKVTNKYSPLPGQPNYGIVMSLRVLHGELSQVREENPLLLKNITLTKKLGFPDVIMPGDVRNDLYICVEKGEFERGGKSTAKNIEVSVMVLDNQGNTIEDSVFGASGMDGASVYKSAVMYHTNSPTWAEIVSLAIPLDRFQAAHLRLEYRHCSTREKADHKKLLGFSFARLMEPSGATLQDGSHELLIYRCDDIAKLKPGLYLSLPSSVGDGPSMNGQVHFSASHKESVTIRSTLCSTKLTQNADLLALLQWKARPERIQDALARALRLDGEELVKFLQDVLDALFSIFSTEDGNSTPHSGLVFHVLVSIFNLLNDSKFEHFKPVMDAYIKDHFAAALVYKGLLSSVQHCADWVEATEKQEPILKCFRSLESIFKFIVESRLLFARATQGQYEESFNRDLYSVVDSLNKVLAISNNPNILSTQIDNYLHHDIEVVAINTLDMLVQTVIIIIDRSSPVLGSLVACLIGLLQLMNKAHFRRLSAGTEPMFIKDLLLRLLLLLRDLLKQEVFPEDWASMRLATNSVILHTMRHCSTVMFKALGAFDYQVWSNYFNLAVAFLTQPSLQLEKFSEVKRENIISKYGDMRVKMGFQILDVWSNLGEHRINFIPSMVGPFLEVTLVPEPELRKATLGIFFDMIQCEYKVHGNFKQVESELIDKLDILISENKGDDEYRQLFNTMEHLSNVLLERVQNEEPAWKEKGWEFVSSVTRLLERLLDYRSVIHGDENRDKRMSCTYNLLNFYKTEINRTEMYVRYIYKLEALHVSAQSYAEAGFTLLLYADCLHWNTHAVKKLELYHTILQYFDMAKIWEKGLPLLKELAHVYEERLFDYELLSKTLRMQAKFYDNIMHQLRLEPEYFRVGFYGTGFPLFVRNKVFVYRGLEYEKCETFTQRIQTEFPAAQIYTKNTPPPHALQQSDVQYIQISNVKPLSDSRLPYKRAALREVPERIARFYQFNDVNNFQLDRPVHKPPIDKDNEFKSLWVERTTLTTSDPLPGILRWFEVVDTKTEEIPPVRFACETVMAANQGLAALINQYTNEPKRHNTSPLSMRLQGVIDANVMGGIAKYQEAFFNPDFIKEHPEWAQDISRLSTLLHEQVDIVESGLVIHGQLVSHDMLPLHHRLLERLDELQASLKCPQLDPNLLM
ncbi:unnamed protein product [Nesidiocoris tenuis]|uniref:C2 DOCK-type domain-containing protein n=1 Tax=Nesidiocoris tenuis TaxID=355587 RepID=A0A6H5H0S1_9HEMI|nr:unnamed protein product [Nesidiocoris tenuis]